MAWVRSGECCRCGACCIGDPGWVTPDTPADDLMRRTPMVTGMCPLYELHGGAPEGEGYCAGHVGAVPTGQEHPYYLGACAAWPQDPTQIADKPGCSYTFEWAD